MHEPKTAPPEYYKVRQENFFPGRQSEAVPQYIMRNVKDYTSAKGAGDILEPMSPRHKPQFYQVTPKAAPTSIQMAPNPDMDTTREHDHQFDMEDNDRPLLGELPSKIMLAGGGDASADDNLNGSPMHSITQPGITIGPPNDKYELEADTIAEKAVSSNAVQRSVERINGNDNGEEEFVLQSKLQLKDDVLRDKKDPELQTKENASEVLPKLQRKCEECEIDEERIQRKENSSANQTSNDIVNQLNSLKGNGRPLNNEVSREFGVKLGADFSGVNVHTDSSANIMTSQLGARAFTHGNDIYFNRGEYNPDSSAGRHLIAHELTHVVQQSGGNSSIQRKPLPKKEFESVTYTFERKISELNDLIDNGKTEEAKKKAQEVISYGSSEIMAQMHGYAAAKALFRLDMADEAEKILDLASRAYFGSYSRMQPSVDAVKLILAQAEIAFKAGKVDYAYTLYEKAFNWLERYELKTTSSSALSVGADTYVKELYPKLVKGIFAIPAYYKSQNDVKKQTEYLSKIKNLFIGSSITDRYADLVSQAFIDLKMVDEGMEILKEGQKDYTPQNSYDDWIYPKSKTEFLLKNAKTSLDNKDWDTAYKLLIATLGWIKDNRKALDSWVLNVGQKRTFIEDSLYTLMNGLLTIVDFFINQAEEAFKKSDPNAAQHLTTASSWLDKIQKDVQVGDLYTFIVAKTNQKEKDSTEATYEDVKDPSKKAMKVKGYEGDMPTGIQLLVMDGFTFSDRRRRLDQIIDAKKGQFKSIKDFYETDKDVVALFKTKKGREPDIHNIDDRKLFWSLKYDHLTTTGGKSNEEAVQALMDSIHGYLSAFTIHTKYDIPDTKTDVISGEYPKSITSQALMDCGVFAMRTAYELSLIRNKANLDFYFVSILNHIMLGIVDKGLSFGWGVSNNVIKKLGSNISTDGVGRSVQDVFPGIPTPLSTTKIGKTDEASLVTTFRAIPDDLFLPDNFSTLSSTNKKKAKENAKLLKAKYITIRKINKEGRYSISVLLREISIAHDKLVKIKEPAERKTKTTEFESSTVNKIDKIRKPYEDYCDRIMEFHNEMSKIRGNKTYTSVMSSLFVQNCYHLILYGAHKLGQSSWKNDKWITATILKNMNTKYTGDPVPWDSSIAAFDFNKD